jgi:hypothetical protein
LLTSSSRVVRSSAPLQHQLPGATEIGHGGLKRRPVDASGHRRPHGYPPHPILVGGVSRILDLPSERAISRNLHGDRRRLRKVVNERVIEPACVDGDRILVARRITHPSEAPDHSIVALVGPVELVSRGRGGRARAADCQKSNAAQRCEEESWNRSKEANEHRVLEISLALGFVKLRSTLSNNQQFHWLART